MVATQVVLYDAALRTKMHMDYFKLIQTALQSGPMAGSKPGKFHVGQEEVAVVAELFLKTVGGLHIRCNFLQPLHPLYLYFDDCFVCHFDLDPRASTDRVRVGICTHALFCFLLFSILNATADVFFVKIVLGW